MADWPAEFGKSEEPPATATPSDIETARTGKLAEIDALIGPHGGAAIALASQAVGVMGDARAVGASVLIQVPPHRAAAHHQALASLIINQVRGIARVLLDIPVPARR